MLRTNLLFTVVLVLVTFGASALAEVEGLELLLSFDEGSGTLAADSSGNGRDGTLLGNLGWAEGVSGTALQCNGVVGEIVDVNGYAGVTGKSDRTVTTWIKTEMNGDILAWGSNEQTKKWMVRVDFQGGGGKLRAEVSGGYIRATTDVRDNEWHHLAVVLDSEGEPMMSDTTLYVDGVVEVIEAMKDIAVDTSDAGTVRIGDGIHDRPVTGLLDEFAVYSVALSADEIAAMVSTATVLEDFEGDPNLPAWTVVESGDPNTFAIVADPLDPNNNVLQLGPGASTVMYLPWPHDVNENDTLSFSLLSEVIDPNNLINNTVVGAADGAGFNWGNYFGYIRMAEAGIDYRDGGDFVNAIPAIDAMTWYNVLLDYDVSARTYDLYIEDVLIAEDAAFRSQDPNGIQKVLIRQWTPDENVGYIDNIVAGAPVPEQPTDPNDGVVVAD